MDVGLQRELEAKVLAGERLSFGADDLGSVVEYKITHDADGFGPPTP